MSPSSTTTTDPGAGLRARRVRLPDGRHLRVVEAGAGPGPLVVFEAGMTAPAATWIHTQRQVSSLTRTLSYDRAGYAGSDPDPQPRTLERLVEDLDDVLDAVGETQPVVLVGHSWGGPILRLFAARHPERVAGLVFVDATLVESMPERNARMAPRIFRLMAFVAAVGGARLIERISLPHGHSSEITDADMAILRRDTLCAQALRTGAREGEHILASVPLLRELQAEGTPPVPTVALQGGRVDRGMSETRPAMNEAAAGLMAAAAQGRLVVVPDAGHLIPQEQPGPVLDAISEVLTATTTVPS
jgi:pimeloyl-ACP methyl ester carboxylesterase